MEKTYRARQAPSLFPRITARNRLHQVVAQEASLAAAPSDRPRRRH